MAEQPAKRIEVLGVPVDCVNMDEAVEAVAAMLEGDQAQPVIAVNPEKVIKAQSDDYLMGRLRSAGLLIPDGIGVVFAARMLRLGKMKRVPGAELMPRICEYSASHGHPVFLYGATDEVNQLAGEELKHRYPALQIAGSQDGYLPEEEMPSLIERINASGAKVLFIALGSPRQEMWMEKYLPQLDIRVCQGVGGTFDVLSGKVRRAPILFRKLNLEWFYRLVTNPRRLMRQTALPRFFAQLLLAKFLPRRA